MKKKLILASQSPRRRELLERCHIPFDIEIADIDETLNRNLPLEAAMEELAWRKAQTVLNRHPEAVIIGADTIVVLERQVLGKPRNSEEAKMMLAQLSGKTHQVMTGVCLLSSTQRISFCDISDVEFYSLEAEEIEAYVKTGEPLDKAGAYGIQGEGFFLARRINGDFYSIMGFPVARIIRALKKFGFAQLKS